MELSNGRKAFYITFSILLSFVIWFLVNNSRGVDVSIDDIPVEFLNAESSLANKGLMLIDGDDAAVDLVLNMPRNLVYGFDTERVRVIADLSAVNSAGTQSVRYSISYPANVNPSQITVRSPTVQNTSVHIGTLFRRDDIEIRCKLVGNVAEGYVAGSLQLTPEVLEIWGQQSDVMKVAYAQVTLNIDNAKSTIVELLKYDLYDYSDNLIENKNLHAASDTIQATLPVISAMNVPLTVRFLDAPGVRVDSFDYSLDVESVMLSGDANLLAQLDSIQLGEVDLTQIDGTVTFVYEIPIPEGLTNNSGVTTATLTISNRDVATKEVTATEFGYENFNAEDRTVEIVTSSLNVLLRGARSTLEGIEPEMVKVVADLTDVTDASGIYTVPAKIYIDGDPDVGAVQNYQLTVRITQTEPNGEEPGGEEGTDGEGTGGEEPNSGGTGNDTDSNG